MPELVYVLCLVTSAFCCFLLFRGYMQRRHTFLLWSALSFLGFTLGNLGLLADLVLFPQIDLGMPRALLGLVSVGVMLYGFVWELGG